MDRTLGVSKRDPESSHLALKSNVLSEASAAEFFCGKSRDAVLNFSYQ